ncbi:conserved hypothetical protein [Culex quinquefasciatus]|uniref:ZAD domain-containing protein n=1 Tax=Culex quinquefasciatus TaxID=7176 RepID=B0X7K6_CULQU|nr:conserved hypothetical protein [Culex quinquefasciatus]|eukprot:XP_001865628.1 conserved hypothetical protein [Culex quinquefasciatus]
MDTSISEDTMASLKRTNEIRMAKMYDPNFPQFVCAGCRKMVNLLHKFNQRREHSARLIRSYVAHGGSYPEAKLLEEKQQDRPKKRSSEEVGLKSKDSKKSRAKDENDNDLKSKEGLSKATKSEKEHSKSKQKVQHKSKELKNDGKDKSLSVDVILTSRCVMVFTLDNDTWRPFADR